MRQANCLPWIRAGFQQSAACWHCPGALWAGKAPVDPGVWVRFLVPGLGLVALELGQVAGATDSLPGKATVGSGWQCVQLWPVGQIVGAVRTGGGRRPALTLAVVFVFSPTCRLIYFN